MKLSSSAVVVSLTGVLLAGLGAGVAGPASAASAKSASVAKAPGVGKSVSAAKAAKSAKTVKPAKSAKPVQPAKPAPQPKKATVSFALTGTLAGTDVAASTVTVTVKGGKLARDTTVVVTVAPTAKINLNDVRSTLAALPVGAHVAVGGTVAGTVRTATRVNAEALPAPEVPEAPETPESPAPEAPSGTE